MGRMTGLEIVHPRMVADLSNFYPQECTIQTATETNPLGELTQTWADYAGHVDIPCRIGRASGQEVKRTNQTFDVATHTITLEGYYPTITPHMRAVVDSVNYDVLIVRTDGDEAMTSLEVQVVS